MKLLKSTLLVLIMTLSSAVIADDQLPEPEPEPITTAELRVFKTKWGNKMFHSFWVPNKKQLIVTLTLSWIRFPEEMKRGFDIKNAEAAELVNPELPKKCEIEQVSGFLADAESTNSVVTLKFKGKGCRGFQRELKKTDIEVYLEEVPFRKSKDEGIEELLVFVEKLR